jgi:hypothetical protein
MLQDTLGFFLVFVKLAHQELRDIHALVLRVDDEVSRTIKGTVTQANLLETLLELL